MTATRDPFHQAAADKHGIVWNGNKSDLYRALWDAGLHNYSKIARECGTNAGGVWQAIKYRRKTPPLDRVSGGRLGLSNTQVIHNPDREDPMSRKISKAEAQFKERHHFPRAFAGTWDEARDWTDTATFGELDCTQLDLLTDWILAARAARNAKVRA